ncbi:large conductance mechanosensitive channel protein MscL [Streptomyces alkaliterrae]|uniref:Large-conductance mechanosensitive channel n=2 Tax=Streptomyces alkaliterrae TaxID=2213162 RepID=A0A7W3X011_9ACTN|nr:large conductance mechanosensitive channel protein MscL [Streptomyces alkaliterrae]MBB1256225.1 large conductance mechanosensitive channel protein MscL [Streptomyces alkaliterrae]MBB1261659.1 large conductance mechanosensitive channel protein MscL [Streptomyces alkaliterrae]
MSEQKQGVLAGFREFLMRGNVVELAVAVVVGTAFTKIVDAMVNGMINPVVGAIGPKNLDQYESCLTTCTTNAAGEIEGVLFKWGMVLSASLTFLITAAVVYFLMIVPMNRYKARQDAKKPTSDEPAPPTELELLTEIRDALVAQRTAGGTTGTEAAQVLAGPRRESAGTQD